MTCFDRTRNLLEERDFVRYSELDWCAPCRKVWNAVMEIDCNVTVKDLRDRFPCEDTA